MMQRMRGKFYYVGYNSKLILEKRKNEIYKFIDLSFRIKKEFLRKDKKD